MAHTGYIMTLANSIIGVGILAMPFCFQKCGIILSIVLLVLSNLITRISCNYLLKSSLLTRKRSFEFLALYAFGRSGKLMVELCIIGYLIGTCIAYFVVIGDLGPQIVAKTFDIMATESLRTWIMILVTIFCIIPLGLLKNVDSLSAVCTVSVGFYFCLVVKVMFEAETHIFSGDWMHHVNLWRPSGILQCLPIFSMALACQMQLFEVVESVNGATLEKLNQIVRSATGICTCVYIFVGFFGYVAFCTQPFSGNILVNFSPSLASDAIKIGFVLSVAFSFPLAIFPCRASIYSLIYRRGHSDATGYIPEGRFKWITIAIVVMALTLGLLIPSIELVIGLVGSTIGIVICVMFPAQCFMKVQKKESTEKMLAQFIFISGFFLMILGTYANLHAIDEKRAVGPIIEVPKVVPTAGSLYVQNIKPKDEVKQVLKIIAPEVVPNVDKVGIKEIVTQARLDPMPKAPKEDIVQPKVGPSPVVEKIVPKEGPKVVEKPADQPKEDIKEDKKEETMERVIPNADKSKDGTIEINKEAIKKEDEVVAEEQKKKENIEEIKQAKDELKQTKELLEKKVIELQLELAKQNLETQHLVEEKLGDIANKVDQIERKVNLETDGEKTVESKKEADKKLSLKNTLNDEPVAENNQPQPVDPVNDVADNKPKIQGQQVIDNVPSDVDKKLSEKGPILAVLTEKLQKVQQSASDAPPKETANNYTVYEPMSYKVGEVMNHENHAPADNQRVNNGPIPLPVFLNATLHKHVIKFHGDTQKHGDEEKKDDAISHDDKLSKPKTESALDTKKREDQSAKDTERENIESIRRDILEVASNREDTTAVSAKPSSNIIREKRNVIGKEFCVNWDLEKDYCRDDNVKNELLMSHNNPPAINSDLKTQQFGRDLKSVDEAEE